MSMPAVPHAIDHLGPVRSCPGCGSRDFQVQQQHEIVVFVCTGCDTAWRYELGFVWAVERSDDGQGPSSL